MARENPLGRALRRNVVTARLLTELRLQQLQRSARTADIRFCQQFARTGSLAIDVGAHVGNWSLALSKGVGRSGQVIALEPNPASFRELTVSSWRTNIRPLWLAASDRSGYAELSIPTGERGVQLDQQASLEPRSFTGIPKRITVRCVRLDELLRRNTRSISMIKIDVEGHESAVLDGALEVLERHRPVLLIEIEERHLVGLSVADVVAWVTQHGYECHAVRGLVLIPWRDFDVTRDQRARLSTSGGEPAQPRPGYVKNFLFRPLSERRVAGV